MTTGLFAEPGAFAVRRNGELMLAHIFHGPAVRSDPEEPLDGMEFNIAKGRSVRGTA